MASHISTGSTLIECFSLSPVTAGNVWPVPSTDAEIWTVPGIDGKGVGLGSLSDPECEIECRRFGTWEDILTWQGLFDSILGKTCAMETYLGQQRSWVVVLEVTDRRISAALIPGENVQYQGTVRVRVIVKYKYTRQPGGLSIFTGV